VTALLSVQNLSKRFGGLQAVADVSLDVTAGEICSVIGPNGAGKTSALNVLTGALPRRSGRIRVASAPGVGTTFTFTLPRDGD